MKRTNLYLTEKQMERLKQRSESEGLSLAELVRRAVDAFLAWDDPMYAPTTPAPNKERHSHPSHE
jgi:Ribbon-helix-helix protein, copG family